MLFKLGPEFGGDFALQRIVVLGDLLMASRPDDEGDRDIRRCRELQRSRAEIHAIARGHSSKLFALFDRGRRDLEILLAVVVTRASSFWFGKNDGFQGWFPGFPRAS